MWAFIFTPAPLLRRTSLVRFIWHRRAGHEVAETAVKDPNLIGSISESLSRPAGAQAQARRPSVVEALPLANRAARPSQFVRGAHQLHLLPLDAVGMRQDPRREQLEHVVHPGMRR